MCVCCVCVCVCVCARICVASRVEFVTHIFPPPLFLLSSLPSPPPQLDPRVIRIPVVPGSDPRTAYGDLYGRGVRGVVLEAFGVGNLPDQTSFGWIPWLKEQTAKGLQVGEACVGRVWGVACGVCGLWGSRARVRGGWDLGVGGWGACGVGSRADWKTRARARPRAGMAAWVVYRDAGRHEAGRGCPAEAGTERGCRAHVTLRGPCPITVPPCKPAPTLIPACLPWPPTQP